MRTEGVTINDTYPTALHSQEEEEEEEKKKKNKKREGDVNKE